MNKNKLSAIVSLLLLLSLGLAACGSSSASTAAATSAPAVTAAAPAATASSSTAATASAGTSATKSFTKAELAKYTGINGNPAYVAVNGKVYDVTNVKEWRSGKHEGYKAGVDLSKEITAAPHGLDALKGVPVVGTYAG